MASQAPVTLKYLRAKIGELSCEARDLVIDVIMKLDAPVKGKLADEVKAIRAGKEPQHL
jgi:uncharacterized protein Smg (DUF494 family)